MIVKVARRFMSQIDTGKMLGLGQFLMFTIPIIFVIKVVHQSHLECFIKHAMSSNNLVRRRISFIQWFNSLALFSCFISPNSYLVRMRISFIHGFNSLVLFSSFISPNTCLVCLHTSSQKSKPWNYLFPFIDTSNIRT